MKNKVFVFIIFVILSVSILCTGISANNDTNSVDNDGIVVGDADGIAVVNDSVETDSVGEIELVIDGIVARQQESMNVNSIDRLINKSFAEYAGTSPSEWFVITLRQYKNGYDYSFDGYVSALDKYTENTPDMNATDMQRISLAYAALGTGDAFISKTLDTSVGKLGIMSYIYGLLLLDCNNYTSDYYTSDDVIDNILSFRLEDGGWALTGSVSDSDITAMTIVALAPYYEKDYIKPVVDEALALLSERQLENGDYSSWGTRNAETAAQVIVALCALDIDCQSDERFIKNGNTLIDGLLAYRLSDGSFSHTPDGIADNSATVQAMYSLVAVWRQMNGFGALYDFTSHDTGPSTETPEIKSGQETTEENIDISYKYPIYIIIAAIASILIITLIITKKINGKNIIVVLFLTAIAFGIVFAVNMF